MKNPFKKTDGQAPPPSDGTSSDPVGKRIAQYVLASGPHAGQAVAVVLIGSQLNDAETGEHWNDLALVETPDVLYQTKSRYSKAKEPGTWHWA